MNAYNFTNVHMVVKKNYIMNKAEEYMPTQGKKEFYPIEEYSLIMP